MGLQGSTATYDRIAVLPMENQTGDTGQAYFADGISREVIGVLTDAGVRVLGHRATLAYKGSTRPAAEIARELEQAYRLLSQAVDQRDLDLLQIIFAYLQMYDMQHDARYAAVLRPLGLTGSPRL